MDLDAATDELYGLVPEAFLPQRAQLAATARSAGDRQLAEAIGALRKPSVGAWAVNQLVRTGADDVDQLTDLAARLRAAQRSLDGAALQTLGRERASLVDALVHATVASAREHGVTVSAAVARDLADTFVAALASSEATAAAVSGRLTRTLTYAGFGDVDLGNATARPLRAVASTPVDNADDAAGPAPQTDPALEAARAAMRSAVAAATETAHRRSVAAAALELAETRVAELSREMARARASRDASADALARAEVADEDAQEQAQAARDALDALRARADLATSAGRLRPSGHAKKAPAAAPTAPSRQDLRSR